jgi:hypothetical protein
VEPGARLGNEREVGLIMKWSRDLKTQGLWPRNVSVPVLGVGIEFNRIIEETC